MTDRMQSDPRGYWNDDAGPLWVETRPTIDSILAPISERLLDAAAPAPGERVVDVGCGGGTTTLELAARVGPTGTVLGVDVSAPLIEHARGRTDSGNLRFSCDDAERTPFAPDSFDLAVSRFGVMFFADSNAAFANLRRGLGERGRLVFACWQAPDRNPWMLRPLRAIAEHLPPPPPPADLPGPFRFADPDALRALLGDAGFTAIDIDPVEVAIELPGDIDDLLSFLQRVGPLRRALAALPPKISATALDRVRDDLASDLARGPIALGSASWLVRASSPS
jgi:SAM-dependent methyltransferase